ncbi:DUF7284 family protein [Methanolobus profundi]|uniref:Uncharacterized protein n=1 Tax=Methanolobus profundi TaxID=487685 RepID=A0A1I4NNR7_9EURY|nr:hypothetical protein [Methanolobus profundi]SFM16803.1 hypothetical protein SAMN04488696_0157 [Methanolobus profundi]
MPISENYHKADRSGIIKDEAAFSTSIDAILFLILVSVSAVILMPSIAANGQYHSASHTSAQDMDTYLLNTIMSSTVDDFEYTLKPAELAGINVNISEDSLLEDAEKTIFSKEQRHRTFSDLVAEGLVLSLYQKDNSTTKVLNPMTKMQSVETEKQIEAHLERTIGQRYDYRFEAHWQPVTGYKVQSEIVVGEEAPVNAAKQKARISLPVTFSVTKDDIYRPFNDSTIYAAMNSPDPDDELHKMFNDSILIASTGCAEMITEIVFPYEYLSSLNGTEISVDSEQLACLTGPDTQNYSSPVIQSVLGCMNYTVNDLYGLTVTIDQEEQSIELDIVNTVNTLIMDENKRLISEHMNCQHADDIDMAIALMCNATDNSSRYELASTQLDAIYRTANPAGADIVLMVW